MICVWWYGTAGAAERTLVTGVGALASGQRRGEIFPGMVEQRCWDDKTAHILDGLPKRPHNT